MAGSGSSRSPERAPLSDSRFPTEAAPSAARWQVLIVEDNRADAYLIQKAITRTNLPIDVHLATDGQLAVSFLDEVNEDPTRRCPDIVLLDINLPRKHGADVLRHIRNDSRCAEVPVVIVSTSNSEQDRKLMLDLGADDYFRKPSDFDEFMKLGDLVKAVLSLREELNRQTDMG